MDTKKLTPLFFFISLGTLITLIVSVTAFLNLTFSALDQVFPDVLSASYQYGYASYTYEGMRSALALLIIVFPVFLILSRLWLRAGRNELSHGDAVVRKWALYLILFLASVMVVVDLVTLVRYFVSGEITIRFICKVSLVLVVAGIAGYFYIKQLQGQDNKKVNILLLVLSSILVFVAMLWSFSVMGSPMSQRALRLDQRRLEDLQSIQWQVINFWQQKEKLPEILADMNDPISSYMVPRDPEFQKGKTYEYSKLGNMKFELCATFTAPIPEGWVEYGKGGGVMPMRDMAVSSMPYPGPGGVGENWDHAEGRTCFERTIDPELYPPYPKAER